MTDKLIRLTKKWWFYGIIIGLNLLIPPIATKDFSFKSWGDITATTLFNSLYSNKWTDFYIPFQVFFICSVVFLFLFKDKVGRYFSLFVAICYIFFAIGQNIAITDKYGVSVATINLIMFPLVSFSWMVDFINSRTKYSFNNFKISYLWMIIPSVLVFWLPFNFKTQTLDLNLKYFITSGSSLTFCLTTPLLLTLLTLNYPNINIITYRITAFIGIIIGLYNMAFAAPILHLPLLVISIYCFRKSFMIEKIKTAHNTRS